jgi:hypothetical protein
MASTPEARQDSRRRPVTGSDRSSSRRRSPHTAAPCRSAPERYGGKAATSGVSTSSGPSFAAPPGDPSGEAQPSTAWVKNCSLSARYSVKGGGEVVAVVDRVNPTHRLARTAVNALIRVDVQRDHVGRAVHNS